MTMRVAPSLLSHTLRAGASVCNANWQLTDNKSAGHAACSVIIIRSYWINVSTSSDDITCILATMRHSHRRPMVDPSRGLWDTQRYCVISMVLSCVKIYFFIFSCRSHVCSGLVAVVVRASDLWSTGREFNSWLCTAGLVLGWVTVRWRVNNLAAKKTTPYTTRQTH